jgi:hypothetical protein
MKFLITLDSNSMCLSIAASSDQATTNLSSLESRKKYVVHVWNLTGFLTREKVQNVQP